MTNANYTLVLFVQAATSLICAILIQMITNKNNAIIKKSILAFLK